LTWAEPFRIAFYDSLAGPTLTWLDRVELYISVPSHCLDSSTLSTHFCVSVECECSALVRLRRCKECIKQLCAMHQKQARNQLGTPGGGEEFSERGPNFVNYVQHIFSGGRKKFQGVSTPCGPSLRPWSEAMQKHKIRSNAFFL